MSLYNTSDYWENQRLRKKSNSMLRSYSSSFIPPFQQGHRLRLSPNRLVPLKKTMPNQLSRSLLSSTSSGQTTPCVSLECPIQTPHSTGVYLHNGKRPRSDHTFPEKPKFGSSNPPPELWMARHRILDNLAKGNDVELTRTFVRYHGRTEEEYDVLKQQANEKIADAFAVGVAAAFANGSQKQTIRNEHIKPLGTPPSVKQAKQASAARRRASRFLSSHQAQNVCGRPMATPATGHSSKLGSIREKDEGSSIQGGDAEMEF